MICRRSERRRVQFPVVLVTPPENSSHSAITVDVSAHGARLHSDASLLENQLVRLHLAAVPDYFVEARVAWVGPTGSSYAGDAGFEFMAPLEGLTA